jgi:glucose/mannose-6-phosphate isomerase
MQDELSRFPAQFDWSPELTNPQKLKEIYAHFVVVGMGGSHLGARLLLHHDPTLPLIIHSDYGLPALSPELLRSSLIIASSFSGETEETIDAAREALDAGYDVAAITTGGALGAFANEHSLPHILLPASKLQPRMAVGAQMLAIAHLMRAKGLENHVREAGQKLDVAGEEAAGKKLAEELKGKIPLIYASATNTGLAYFWKIAFNETTKIPAFYNVFPEVCHNELSGFDVTGKSKGLVAPLHVVMLGDTDDHPRTQKRFEVMRTLLQDRGVAVSTVSLQGASKLEKALSAIVCGVWAALSLAQMYGAKDAETPLIVEFKKNMQW